MKGTQSHASRALLVASWVGIVLLFWVTPVWSYDFTQLGTPKEATEKRNLTNEVTTIRRGNHEPLKQFEVESLGGELIWVAVGRRTLHISTGSTPQLVPGGLTRTLNGEVITVDLYPMPADPDQALLSGVYRSYSGVTSVVFALTRTDGGVRLRRIDRQGGVALRPVGTFLHGQTFHTSSFWSESIHRYRSAEAGYRQAESVSFPVKNPRLLSAAWLSEGRWALVDPSGNLQLVTSTDVLDVEEGDYGATSVTFTSERAMKRRPEKAERYRLPPFPLRSGTILAVPRNPDTGGGLLDFFSGDSGQRPSVIRLFERRRQQLTRIASIGPLEGRISDLHVSSGNDRQLLWLRTLRDGSYRIEMVDLSK